MHEIDTDPSLARCRFGRLESGAVVNVTKIEADGLTCAPSPATLMYTIGGDK